MTYASEFVDMYMTSDLCAFRDLERWVIVWCMVYGVRCHMELELGYFYL